MMLGGFVIGYIAGQAVAVVVIYMGYNWNLMKNGGRD
jgi:hypothetical protein